MAWNADDVRGDTAIVVVNPDEDTSLEALRAWIEELEGDGDWISLPNTAAEMIDEDRAARGS